MQPGAAVENKTTTRRTRKSETARIADILDELDRLYPDAHCELVYKSPFELLIAVILSAQCTDDRVNMITPTLFARFPDPAALAQADLEELEKIIYSTGFYRNKAKNIKACAKKLVEKFGGKVPQSMPDLLSLPGVARKTANVVLATCFNIPSGVIVDTHVIRLSGRIGLSQASKPEDIERDLMRLVPQDQWTFFGPALILLGRYVCTAKKPDCPNCVMQDICPKIGVAR